MKALIFGVALCAASLPALAQTNVSVSIGQPGFYGRIDIGDYVPRPVVYAPQPVIIAPAPHYVAEPVYLRVPPGHRKHWAKFCGRYGVKIYMLAIGYNHIHFQIRMTNRYTWKPFIRGLWR